MYGKDLNKPEGVMNRQVHRKVELRDEVHLIAEELKENNSPFRHMAVCATVVGVGSAVAIGTDIMWVIGDMIHAGVAPHHLVVVVGLVLALVLTVVSFYWLFVSLRNYVIHHVKKANKIARLEKLVENLTQRVQDLENK